ncbi:AMP-binding protein [Endozoicomonas sp. OPT23]|uniref:AMP-binding protein n=1 Tax=Endozoicomonas sp. OPT23 TaxID=2072845 RepID=UPI001890C9C0|nr:AMP-binding protein [Endozoicomonas sp. OPT23]
MPFLSQLVGHPADRVAIIDSEGEHTYQALLEHSRKLAGRIREQGEQYPFIAFLTGRDASFIEVLLAIWLEESAAVPLDPLMSQPEWERRLLDIDVRCLVYSPEKKAEALLLGQRLGIQLICSSELSEKPSPLIKINPSLNALVLFTSGTSRCARGVIHTFSSLQAQVKSICEAWDWHSHDRMLHILPMSHIHGLVCGLLAPLAAGACCEILPGFKTSDVWEHLAKGQNTLLTAVPAIYHYLVETWEKASPEQQTQWAEGAASLRIAMVGSSQLMPTAYNGWLKITGKALVTRYGLTEAGMVLSQNLDGSSGADTVGKPLYGVSVRLVDDHGNEMDGQGELEIRSPQLFKGYYGKEDLNQQAFRHGWFRTGDMAMRVGDEYRLLGRRSIDIITSGGYRISALELESILDEHPEIRESAVLGTPCDNLGEAIYACIVPDAQSGHIDIRDINNWLFHQVATYKLPTHMQVVEQLPKTPVGKIDKLRLKESLVNSTRQAV